MQECRVFRVDYDNGHMDLNVGMFFGTSAKTDVKKALQLIRRNCRDSDRLKLIDDLCFECKIRQEVLDKIGYMEYTRRELLQDFYAKPLNTELRIPEKAVKKQRDRIKEVADLLKKERWF